MTISQTEPLRRTPSQALWEVGPPAIDLRAHGAFYDEGRCEVLSAITHAERILVSSHARPDGDAIGSILACGMIFDQMGKQVRMVSSDRVPLLYRWLPCAAQIDHVQQVSGDFDLVILLECDGIERSRLGGLESRRIVNIDHHASGKAFASVNWIEPEASAVAEMVFDLAVASGVKITADMATCLYTAVLTDTGSFCYEGTDAHTLRLAAELVRLGACPAPIAQHVYFSNPLSKIQLLGVALSTLHREGRLAWLWVTQADMQRTSAAEEDCEGIVNYAIAIEGVDVAVFLRELPDGRIRLSLRSKGTVDVAVVAEAFGGGGHANASGCTVPGPLKSATQQIVGVLRNVL
jgi:phosphoesterase RecJ-like protein